MEFAERARLAYIQGWVRSLGPMTPRVAAGCKAAVALAQTRADDPDVLEATLKLGELEGHWAAIYRDREAVHTKYGKAITAAYRALCKATLDVPGEVRLFRRMLDDGTDTRTAATVVAHRLMGQALTTSAPQYRAAINTIRDGIAAANQAGRDAATLLLGPRETADNNSGSNDDDDQRAAGALLLLVRGNTTDVADQLASLADDGATEEEMVAAIEDGTSGDAEVASDLLGDSLLGQAFGAGMVAAFVAAGLTQALFITAGDHKVCPRCDELEQGNPYLLLDLPPLGQHPRCRCTHAPY